MGRRSDRMGSVRQSRLRARLGDRVSLVVAVSRDHAVDAGRVDLETAFLGVRPPGVGSGRGARPTFRVVDEIAVRPRVLGPAGGRDVAAGMLEGESRPDRGFSPAPRRGASAGGHHRGDRACAEILPGGAPSTAGEGPRRSPIRQDRRTRKAAAVSTARVRLRSPSPAPRGRSSRERTRAPRRTRRRSRRRALERTRGGTR